MLETDLFFKAEINLYYDLFLPENLEKDAPLLIAVHGYGARKRSMMREAVLLAPQNFVIASIQAPHQHFRKTDAGYKTGFGWLTDFKPEESIKIHQKFVSDVIENLSNRNLIDANQVFLLGFSQACALNFRYAFTHPEKLRGIAGVCGGIPSDFETNKNYQPTSAKVFYLYTTEDEFYPLEKYKTFDAKLKNYLPNYQSKVYDARHEITDQMREDIKNWL
ncbi:MAG: alpha/beta hydrolase [Pyrinomonadaceae bacterium]